MSQPQVRVYNPEGPYGFKSMKAAARAVARGKARWRVRNALVEYIEASSEPFVSECRPAVHQTPKPPRMVKFEVQHIDSAIFDAQLGQTFLAYPQRSLNSYEPDYPGLAGDRAGLG